MKTKLHTATLWLLALVCLLAGCKGISSKSKQAGNVRQALLSGYPEDIMPLFANQKVLYCAYEQKEQPNAIYGRYTYTVRFSSTAKKNDALQLYKSKFTRIDDANATEFLSGSVGNNPVSVTIIDNAGTSDITITIGLTDAQIPTANPYFGGYPDTVKAMDDKNALSSKMFERFDQAARSDKYTITYLSKMSETEFVSYYEKTYRNSKDFAISVQTSGRTYRFKDGKYQWSIAYTRPQDEYNTALITVSCLIES